MQIAGILYFLVDCRYSTFYCRLQVLKDHIGEVSKRSFQHFRNISHIRKFLSFDAVQTVVHALVCSQNDTNNSLYCGLPYTQLQGLQRIQNAAARVIYKKSKYEHVTPLLYELHWLPVSYRILFKLLVLTFKCIHGDAPTYLSNLITIKPISTFGLRSNEMPYLLQEVRSKLVNAGDRSFAIAAPSEWDKLPSEIGSLPTLNVFKSKLKTHLFKLSFSYLCTSALNTG